MWKSWSSLPLASLGELTVVNARVRVPMDKEGQALSLLGKSQRQLRT